MSKLNSVLAAQISVLLFVQTFNGAIGEVTNSTPFWASKAKAHKTTAVWVIKDFSNFAVISSPTFSHEISNLNWTVKLDRLTEKFSVYLHAYEPDDPTTFRISLNFETCEEGPVRFHSAPDAHWASQVRDSKMEKCIYRNTVNCYKDEFSYELKGFPKITDSLRKAQSLLETHPWCEDTVQLYAELTIFDDEKHTDFKCEVDQTVAACMGEQRFQTILHPGIGG